MRLCSLSTVWLLNTGAAESRAILLQIDNMLNGTSVLDDDDRFADLPALLLVNSSGDQVALPDLTARASWEACCATVREGLSQMQPAQVSNQVCFLTSCEAIHMRVKPALDTLRCYGMQAVLAAREIMKQTYNGHLKAEDDLQGSFVRDVSLATHHPRTGPCVLGACPLDPNSTGQMEPATSEAQAYLQLQHIVRQLDASRIQARMSKEASASHQLLQLQTLLDPAATATQSLLESCSYHWVNLTSVFQSLAVS